MHREFGDLLRTRRQILGLSQRDLAARAGVKQSLIAAIEAGRRRASKAAYEALTQAVALRPSVALAARRDDVRALFARAGLSDPRVFGSVARGEDHAESDLDLVVLFTDRHDIVDLLALQHELEELLTVRVDIVDGRAEGVLDRARSEPVGP